MIDRLRSHLKSEKGFTLIELLVVIAIIAILVVIVIVAINPVERLNEANDREAQSNVRATGTLISTCITSSLGNNGPGAPACETAAEINGAANINGTVPAPVTIVDSNGAQDDVAVDVCAWQLGRPGRWYMFEYDGTGAGTTTQFNAAPVAGNCAD